MDTINIPFPTTSRGNDETILALEKRFPGIGTRLLGSSGGGRPLRALTLGSGPRRVLFSAAHHANEWLTCPVLLKYAYELALAAEGGTEFAGTDARGLLEAVTVHMLPMVDPDGVDLVTGAIPPESGEYAAALALGENYPDIPFPRGWKADLRGVDLNLQYPAGWLTAREIKFSRGYDRPGPRDYVGRYPLSQPESRLLAAYTLEVDPAAVVALHSQGEVIYWQYGDVFVPGARELGERMAAAGGYALADTPYDSSFAGYKDWFIRCFGRPGYTVEVGSGTNPLPEDMFDAIFQSCRQLLTVAALG